MNWSRMRAEIRKDFPKSPGTPAGPAPYLRNVDDNYATDAYNSLSIEGYQVSAELIERVRLGNWDPQSIKGDHEHHDALAARGYWQTFQLVKDSVHQALRSQHAGVAAEHEHHGWYRELFAPIVTAGILKPEGVAGYRNGSVHIRRSMYSPPRAEAVRELMPAFFELQNEPQAAVRVVLGHFAFVYIHPYFDGNGRMGRFLMNVMAASGGYPWNVIPLDQRDGYMASLEAATVEGDIRPFARFIGKIVSKRRR
jgi:Fic/DOC family